MVVRRSTARRCAALLVLTLLPSPLLSHCDTLDGPVVADARRALEARDLAPVLKWIPAADEAELRATFERALAVRTLGDEARELADRALFETLVRLHRASEGAPFTGLQPAGAAVEPIVLAADRALARGSADELAAHLEAVTSAGLQRRFEAAAEARRHAEHDAEAGRRYVAAYVELTHWLERIERDASGDAGHAPAEDAAHRH